MLLPDGTIRDSAFYSITKEEWRDRVKDLLKELLIRVPGECDRTKE